MPKKRDLNAKLLQVFVAVAAVIIILMISIESHDNTNHKKKEKVGQNGHFHYDLILLAFIEYWYMLKMLQEMKSGMRLESIYHSLLI
jgi:CO dehydrogenase/acetyl-CoA synthase epsilon subunit